MNLTPLRRAASAWPDPKVLGPCLAAGFFLASISSGGVTAGCGAARPDLAPFAAATADLYQGAALAGNDVARRLAPLCTPVVCPAALPAIGPDGPEDEFDRADNIGVDPGAPARVAPGACFERAWRSHLAALLALADHADGLSRIARASGRGDRVEAATAEVERLLGALAAPAPPGPVADAAAAALAGWRREPPARRLAEVLARAGPHIAAVLDALEVELADTRVAMWHIGRKLHLDRLDAHDDALLLREHLEARRRSLAARFVPGDRPAPADSTDILTEIERIEALLPRLPNEDGLAPRAVEAALATIDALARAVRAWRDAHARLAAAGDHGPSLHRLRAAIRDLYRLTAGARDRPAPRCPGPAMAPGEAARRPTFSLRTRSV